MLYALKYGSNVCKTYIHITSTSEGTVLLTMTLTWPWYQYLSGTLLDSTSLLLTGE